MARNFMNMFIRFDDDGDAPKPAPVDKDPPKPPSVAPTITAPLPRTVAPVIPGQVDPEMAKILEDAISQSNLPGFDYIEFRDALVKMANIPMTEEQRFNAVFAAAQAIGTTKEALINAINHYLTVVETKRVEFYRYVEGVTDAEVTSKEKALQELEQSIQKEAAQIQALTESIQKRRQQQAETNAAMATARTTIQNKVNAFEATRAALVSSLETDRSKIDTFLK